MDIPGPTSSSNQPVLSPSRPTSLLQLLSQNLPRNQTLLATVERILPSGEAELRIGNALLRVSSPVSLANGQPLTLRVENSPQGLLLRVSQDAKQIETLAHAWRTVLPRQAPLADVFNRLVANLQQAPRNPSSAKLPQPLRDAVQELVRQLPDVKTLSRADGLRKSLQNAGTLLEARLFAAAVNKKAPDTGHDLKANLLRLAHNVLQFQSANRSLGNALQSTVNAAVAKELASSKSLAGNPTASTTTSANSKPASGRPAGLNLYTSLLNTATQSTQTSGDKALPVTPPRPLLPPLPLPADSTTPADKHFLRDLQELLSRFLPLPIPGRTASGTPAGNAKNIPTVSQALLRIVADLLTQIETGLARIQQHQLNSFQGDETARTILNLELPLFNGNNFNNLGVRIQRETEQNEQGEMQHLWRAVVNFDLPELGNVQAIITIRQQQVHTEFRSEKDTTTETFKSHIETLKHRLIDAGLKPGNFNFTTGRREHTADDAPRHGILSTKA